MSKLKEGETGGLTLLSVCSFPHTVLCVCLDQTKFLFTSPDSILVVPTFILHTLHPMWNTRYWVIVNIVTLNS